LQRCGALRADFMAAFLNVILPMGRGMSSVTSSIEEVTELTEHLYARIMTEHGPPPGETIH
jgi:hypothetical protein